MKFIKLNSFIQIRYCIYVAAIVLTIYNFLKFGFHVEDFIIYIEAVNVFADGKNPYDLMGFPYWPFVYPPIFLSS